jgi:hypothetical protein
MGISLNGLTPAGTYPGLIKTGDNTAIDGTPKVLSDGNGNNLPMEVSTTGVNLTGSPTVNFVAIANTTQVAAKQDTLVSGTNIKTINGTSVLGSGNIVTPSTPPSGVAGAIQFSAGSAFNSDAANLFWDDTNNRLGVGTNAPIATGHFKGSGSTSATTSLLVQNSAGTEALKVDDGGLVNVAQLNSMGFLGVATTLYITPNSNIKGNGSGIIQLGDAPETGFNRLQFGGTTSSFQSLKRFGAEINFRLADDSGFCNIEAGQIKTGAGTFSSNTLFVSSGGGLFLGYGGGGGNLNLFPNSGTTAGAILYTTGFIIGSASINASAKLQVESTTQGFLPPRMTTTQRDLISSPAAGLMIYNTTTAKLNVYTTAWEAVTSL